MRMEMKVSSLEDFKKRLADLIKLYRRLTPDRYLVCVGSHGIAMVPLMSSRHSHTFVFNGFENVEDFTKAIEHLRRLGFVVYSDCSVKPDG